MPQVKIGRTAFYNDDPKFMSRVIQCLKNAKSKDTIRFVDYYYNMGIRGGGEYREYFHPLLNDSREYYIDDNGLVYFDAVVVYDVKINNFNLFRINSKLSKYIGGVKCLSDGRYMETALSLFGTQFYPARIIKCPR